MFELRILSGLHRGAALPLDEHTLVIGADDDADVVLVDPDIATRHATLAPGQDGWTLSTLDGAVLGAEHNRPLASLNLQAGDFARLGHVWLCVAAEEAPWENPPPEPARNSADDAGGSAMDGNGAHAGAWPAGLDDLDGNEPYRDSPLDDGPRHADGGRTEPTLSGPGAAHAGGADADAAANAANDAMNNPTAHVAADAAANAATDGTAHAAADRAANPAANAGANPSSGAAANKPATGKQWRAKAAKAGTTRGQGWRRWKMVLVPTVLVTILSACAAYSITSRPEKEAAPATSATSTASAISTASRLPAPGGTAQAVDQAARLAAELPAGGPAALPPGQPPTAEKKASPQELREAFRHRLKEVDLLKRFNLDLRDGEWTMQASLDADEAARFDRILKAFVQAHNIKFPVHATVGGAEVMLPFRVREVISGANASIVTQDGKRLYVGDEHKGLRLVAVDGHQLQFDGERKIKVKW